MKPNQTKMSGSSSGDLGSVKYALIEITLTQSDSTL